LKEETQLHIDQLGNEINELKITLQIQTERNSELLEHEGGHTIDQARLTAEIQALTASSTTAAHHFGELQNSNNTLQDGQIIARQELQRLTTALKEKTADLEKEQDNYAFMERQLNESNNSQSNTERGIRDLQREIEHHQERYQQLSDRYEQAVTLLNTSKDRFTQDQAQIKHLQNEILELNSVIEQEKHQNSQFVDESLLLTEKMGELESQCRLYQDEKLSAEIEIDTLKRKLTATQSSLGASRESYQRFKTLQSRLWDMVVETSGERSYSAHMIESNDIDALLERIETSYREKNTYYQ